MSPDGDLITNVLKLGNDKTYQYLIGINFRACTCYRCDRNCAVSQLFIFKVFAFEMLDFPAKILRIAQK